MPSHVIVLCDVSHSVNTASKGKYDERISAMITGCQELAKAYPPNSHIQFYLISSNAYEHALLDLLLPEVYQRGRSETLFELDKKVRSIKTVIKKAVANPEERACILTSVEAAYSSLALQQKSNCRNELVIFSDMLEDCHNTPVSPIQMHLNADSLLSPAEKQKFLAYHADHSWNDLKVKLRIIMTTPYIRPQSAKQVRDVWTQLFKNLGAEQGEKGDLFFERSPQFPVFTAYAE